MNSKDVRKSFLQYFEERSHRIVPSSSLIPIDDPTLLFTNAGMNQFKLVFTGGEKRPYKRAASSQKCIRAGGKHNDLENVGQTARHQTFFEMLGNFSFGDYFKAEAIEYAWEFLTKVVMLPEERLWASIYLDDDEAFGLFEKIVPELKGKILRFDEKENYWSMGDTGPCGPCAEIHFDRGEKYGTGPEDVVNGESERFVEIWNLVFMQFEKDEQGIVTPLPKPSIDTGLGLERIVCVLQECDTNYETDLFVPIIKAVESLCGRKCVAGPEGISFRVIADHIRALTFAFADGAVPSSGKRGSVLRKILNRAARHGRLLGMRESFLYKLPPVVRDIMGDTYPELKLREVHITELIRAEEERFEETYDNGLDYFDRLANKVTSSGGMTISGDEVFKLHDTYGFDSDLTLLSARERGLDVDMDGFERALRDQQQRSRQARGAVPFVIKVVNPLKTEFCGYDDHFMHETIVIDVKPLKDDLLAVILERTPFYAESGGQVGDKGILQAEGLEFKVVNTLKEGNTFVHVGQNVKGDISEYIGKSVTAAVDKERQKATQRNHTATHLLQTALREVLGEHVQQASSLVKPEGLRFDFSHFKAVTPEELREIERRVNEQILRDLPVRWQVMPIEKAKAAGAMALFDEKYGDNVRMVEVEGFSRELCGGTHVSRTGEIGLFLITQETAIAAGMRRMEAVTGDGAYRLASENRDNLEGVARMLKVASSEVGERVATLAKKVKELQKQLDQFSQAQGDEQIKSNLSDVKQKGDVSYLVADIADRKEAQQYLDNVKNDKRKVVVVLKQESNYFIVVSKAAADNGLSAKKVIAHLNDAFDGRGGGKDTFAQGGSKQDFSLNDLSRVLESAI
ncbi:MAG: alanine--tRNA ligase [candidate division Zixibacteria bacterium]|nr:alanine--tRNA ligase [candidate division Zixibacteria bacterium]MBU1469080.1 alanine--tRNA ligase [candidate division Zixibacteria bacterium]MBU2624656.1 alanine--tRNA ligase [candidate division Zixibacteria bacterium]